MKKTSVNLNGSTVSPAPNGWYWGSTTVTLDGVEVSRMVGIEVTPKETDEMSICTIHTPRKFEGKDWKSDAKKDGWYKKEIFVGEVKFFNFN